MADNQTIDKAKTQMQKSVNALNERLASVRAGRANASLLNNITVDYYGAETPLNQIAAIHVPEARVLTITPYDKTAVEAIEKAINVSNLGINPSVNDDVIRLVVPQLTGDRRKEIAKEVSTYGEDAKIAIRNIRRDAMDSLKKAQKEDDISDDEIHTLEDNVQKLTNDATKNIDQIVKDKQKEITED